MKHFIKRNDPFTCEYCGKAVPAGTRGTVRNHCPFCLASKHVDQNPGDRLEGCAGRMPAIRAYYLGGQIHLVHRCERCGLERENEAAETPCVAPDDLDLIYALMRKASMEV